MELSLFVTRLGAGLVFVMAATSAKEVNTGFFRSTMLVVLGLLVVALLAGWNTASAGILALLFVAACVSYVDFVAWCSERLRPATAILLALSAICAVLLVLEVQPTANQAWPLQLANVGAGACLLGASLGAMLLGHYYLTAPWMSLAPLQRLILAIAGASLARLALTAVGTVQWLSIETAGQTLSASEAAMYLGVRWVVGIAAPIVLAGMAWQTLKFKNTQAATGILYVVVICVLIGEVMAVPLHRALGVSL